MTEYFKTMKPRSLISTDGTFELDLGAVEDVM